MSYGFVYLIVNREMPNVFKLGFTERSPHLRADELSRSTSVPYQFDVLCYIEVHNCQAVEAELHRFFQNWRVRPDREFFYWHHGNKAANLAVGALWHWPNRLAFTLVDEVATEVFEGFASLEVWEDPKVYGHTMPADFNEPVPENGSSLDHESPETVVLLDVIAGGDGGANDPV